MIKLEKRHREIVIEILSKYPYDFYAYGSRVKGEARKLSDLDLCYYDDISLSIRNDIGEKFTESNLPFLVEVVAWKNMRPAFQKAIQKDLTLFSSSARKNEPET